MVVLDTNILIDHLRQRAQAASILDRLLETTREEHFSIAVVTIQELYRGKSTREELSRAEIAILVSEMQILPYTPEAAQLAGKLMRDHIKPIEFADAAIAATAMTHDAQLLTLNTKDFAGIPGLKLLSF